jgi:hypothetical protein
MNSRNELGFSPRGTDVMAKYVPQNMEWFLAEMIQEIRVGNDDNLTVWVNTILIKASSLEEAYSKSNEHGLVYNSTYTNTDGEEVVTRFRGLRNLLLIYEPLEDGSEIMWEEYEDQTEQDIEELVTPKEQLGVFITHGPDVEDSETGELTNGY